MQDKLKLLEELHSRIISCRKCELHSYRTHAVPGEGNLEPFIMFIGEAPGRDEDLQGRPFVGAAGKLLTQLLQSINLSRQDVFITNVVKCKPLFSDKPAPPTPSQINKCKDYLFAQIALIKPKIICILGNYALKVLLGDELSISKVHGISQQRSGIVFLPLYHPAAGLYNENIKRTLFSDFKKLRVLLEKLSLSSAPKQAAG